MSGWLQSAVQLLIVYCCCWKGGHNRLPNTSRCPTPTFARENQQLRSEAAALAERLRMGAASAGGDSLAAHAAAVEADAARQQLSAAQLQVAEAEAEADRARGDAREAQAASRKLERDLEDLSAAYGTLDAHVGSLQQQVEQLQEELAQQRAAATAAEQRAAAAAASPAGAAASEEEVEQRVAAARAEAAAEATAEADDAMTDLLVCLGQEEAKVGVRERRRGEATEGAERGGWPGLCCGLGGLSDVAATATAAVSALPPGVGCKLLRCLGADLPAGPHSPSALHRWRGCGSGSRGWGWTWTH